MLTLSIPGLPCAKGSYRAVRGRLLTSTSGRHEAAMKLWHDTIVAAARHAIGPRSTPIFAAGAVFVAVVFGFPLALRHFTDAGEVHPDTPWLVSARGRGLFDGDKGERLLLDALTDSRVVWTDDVQAHVMTARVYLPPGVPVSSTVLLATASDLPAVVQAWERMLDDARLNMERAKARKEAA